MDRCFDQGHHSLIKKYQPFLLQIEYSGVHAKPAEEEGFSKHGRFDASALGPLSSAGSGVFRWRARWRFSLQAFFRTILHSGHWFTASEQSNSGTREFFFETQGLGREKISKEL